MGGTNDYDLVWCIRTCLASHLCAEVARRLADTRPERRRRRPVAIVAPDRVTPDQQVEWSLVVHIPRWDVREVRHQLSRGACGFVTDACTADEIAQTILGAAVGRSDLPRHLLAEIAQVDAVGGARLGDGDRAILELAATGASQSEIAEVLHWSERTIRRRLTAIRQHLGAMSTVEAVAIAATRGELRRRGLVDLPAPEPEMAPIAVPVFDGATRRAHSDLGVFTGRPTHDEVTDVRTTRASAAVRGS